MLRKMARPLALTACLLFSNIAVAQVPASVFLEDMTWTEVRDAVNQGKTTIIIPIGGTEQSGPYVALGKHNIRATIIAGKIAEELGNAIVAPVIAYAPEGGFNPPTEHMKFPGTITVPDDVFEKTLETAANSFAVHGFKNVVFLGDHGGYQKDIKVSVTRLNKAWAGSGIRAINPPEYYQMSSDGYAELLRKQGYKDNEIGTHAALADTSLQLAVAPQMVRQAELKSAPKPTQADGVYGGDPRRSTAELGKLGIDAIVQVTVQAIRRDTGNP